MLQKTLIAVLITAALGIGGAGTAARAQLPRKPAPEGMTEVAASEGRILTSRMGGTTSARKMLLALKIVSGEYFDQPFVVTRAFADHGDRNLQAAFTARLGGVPVRGVAAVHLAGGGGQGTLLFDNAGTFARSFHALTARQGGGTGGSPAPETLTPRDAPDGSCRISLPPGYRITGSYKGCLDIVGPHDAAMGLGSYTVCTRHEAAEMFPGIPTVDFNDPVRAMVDYAHFMARKAGVSINVRVLDVRPVPEWTNGRAAYVRYSAQFAGKSAEGFGLFAVSPTDTNQAVFYQSFISASTATYRSQFPGMMRAWGTWSVNPGVFQERLTAAAQSMRGMSDIITSAHTSNDQTNARVSEAWGDYMRDQSTWANPDSGARYKVSNTLTNGGGVPSVNGVPLQPVPLSGL